MNEANSYAMSLILIGIALSRDGDDKRVTEQLVPEMLGGTLPCRFLKAVKGKDRRTVCNCLASIGVLMQDSETAVDAILRTHIMDARLKAQNYLEQLDAASKNEEKIAMQKVSNQQKS